MEELRVFVSDLQGNLTDVTPIVERSVKHKTVLRQLANKLSSVLDDTKKYAATALEAARVYKTIVDAIEDAMGAVKLANETVHQANMKVYILNDVFSVKLTISTIYIVNPLISKYCHGQDYNCGFSGIPCTIPESFRQLSRNSSHN